MQVFVLCSLVDECLISSIQSLLFFWLHHRVLSVSARRYVDELCVLFVRVMSVGSVVVCIIAYMLLHFCVILIGSFSLPAD